MDDDKKKKLEGAGWKEATAREFMELFNNDHQEILGRFDWLVEQIGIVERKIDILLNNGDEDEYGPIYSLGKVRKIRTATAAIGKKEHVILVNFQGMIGELILYRSNDESMIDTIMNIISRRMMENNNTNVRDIIFTIEEYRRIYSACPTCGYSRSESIENSREQIMATGIVVCVKCGKIFKHT